MSFGTRRRRRATWLKATGADEQRLLAGFNNAAKHPYVLIARQITPDTEAKVMHLGLPGLEFEPGGKRYYPDGRNAAQLVGVTDPDNNGVSGLELGLQNQIRAAAGGKVATSIDMRVQYILAHEVEAARQTFTARAAGGVVMDVEDGRSAGHGVAAQFRSQPAPPGSGGDPTRNLMAQDVYELGSGVRRSSASPWRSSRSRTIKSYWMRSFTIGQVYHASASGPSMKPNTCPPPCCGAPISWRSPPTSARRRSRCAQGPRASTSSSTSHGPAETGADKPAGNRSARGLYPRHVSQHLLGPDRGPPPCGLRPGAFPSRRSVLSRLRRKWCNGGRRITPTFLRSSRPPIFAAEQVKSSLQNQRADA